VSPIAWREEFSVGLPDVDHEHRELIAMINELAGSLGPQSDVQAILGALGEIHARIAAHFALEEREMRQLNYSALAAHKGDHERLLDDILDIMAGVESPGGYDPALLDRRLSAWFTEHFRTHDAQLHHWLEGRRPGRGTPA
jgi:hemerythrin-like metal-binding protein